MSGRPRELAESTSRFSLRTLFATSEEPDLVPTSMPPPALHNAPHYAQGANYAYAAASLAPPQSFVPQSQPQPQYPPQHQPSAPPPTPPSTGLTFSSLGGGNVCTGSSFGGTTAATSLKFQLPNLAASSAAADPVLPSNASYDAPGIPPMLGLALSNAPKLGPAPSTSAPTGGSTSGKRTLRSGFLTGGGSGTGSVDDAAREITRLNATIDELTDSLDRSAQKSHNAEQAIIRGNQMVAQLKASHEQAMEALKSELRAAQHRESVAKSELAALPRTTQLQHEQFAIAAKSVAELQESRDVEAQHVATLKAEIAYERSQRSALQTKLDSTTEAAQTSSTALCKAEASLLVAQNDAESLRTRLEALEARVPAHYLSDDPADAMGVPTNESAAETVTELEAYVAGVREDAEDAVRALESELAETRQKLADVEEDRERVAVEVTALAEAVEEKTAACASLHNDVQEHARRVKTAELKIRAETERATRAESSSKAAHELMETMAATATAPAPSAPAPSAPKPAPRAATLERSTMRPLSETHAQKRARMSSLFEDHLKAWNFAQKNDRHVPMRTAALCIDTMPSGGRIGIMNRAEEEELLANVEGEVRKQVTKVEAASPGPDRKREQKTKETVVAEMRMSNMLVAVTRDLRAHVQASVSEWERAAQSNVVQIVGVVSER